MKKIFTVLLIFSIFRGLIFAEASSEGNPIKIGLAGPHTDYLAPYGIPAKNAAQIVIDRININGGILGRPLELYIVDDDCDPKTAPEIAAQMAEAGVIGVIGHICAGSTKAALGVYLHEKIIVISPSAVTPSLTKSGDYPNFFRTVLPDDAQPRLEADFVISRGFKKIAVIHDKQSYGQGLAERVKEILDAEAGVDVVVFEGIQTGAFDYSAVINKIANAGAEAIIYGGYHPEASKLVAQIAENQIDIAFISGDGVQRGAFIDLAKENAEGVYASGPNDVTSTPLAIQARNAHIAEYGEEPGPFFYEAIAATQALVKAIENAGSADYEDIREALTNNFVDTALGKISFDKNGDIIGLGFSMYQVKNGKYIKLH